MTRRRKPRGRAKLGPDEGLARENFPQLNQSFYEMRPHDYLRFRLRGLYLWHGYPPAMEQLFREEMKVDGVTIKFDRDEADSRREDEKDRERFSVIEAEVLLHHVSETLLRLYAAHAKLPLCPWIEISRERNFSTFKKKIEKLQVRLVAGDEADAIHNVFHVNADRTAIKPTPDAETWSSASENIAKFLNYYATYFLDSASYNAVKHGLALTSGEAGVELGVNSENEPVLSRSGPAIEYLKVSHSPPHSPRWVKETKWISVRRAIALIFIGCNLIEAIWNVGAGRYRVRELDVLKLFDHPPFDDVMKRTESGNAGMPGVFMDQMAESLLYYETPAPSK